MRRAQRPGSGQTMDPTAFRRALSNFPTGVTVVTTACDGVRVGLTASSFNSVALSPPLVLWSLSKRASCMSLFSKAAHFAVHVLSVEQLELSRLFATAGIDRFQDLELLEGVGKVPLLPDCCARFECRKAYEYEGGDHIIFVGEVLNFDWCDKEPLVFRKGNYAIAAAHPSTKDKSGERVGDGVIGLLGRCYQGINVPFRKHVESIGMDVAASKILALLSYKNPPLLNVDSIGTAFPDIDVERTLVGLAGAGMVQLVREPSPSKVQLLPPGARAIAPILAAALDVEQNVRTMLGADGYSQVRSLLSILSQQLISEA
jgi:3-hydroxy-9,10-secoandrosta-1,3,5(10)-triene-9,17-dione monooxygenase reductase component